MKTFKIPENTREISVSETDGRIIIEFVPEVPEFKEGDVVCGKAGNPYILKNMDAPVGDRYYAWTRGGCVSYGGHAGPAVRLATPAEAQQLFDALAKDGKRWNAETMQVEEIPEIDRILEWVETRAAEGNYNHKQLCWLIETYIKEREAQQCK